MGKEIVVGSVVLQAQGALEAGEVQRDKRRQNTFSSPADALAAQDQSLEYQRSIAFSLVAIADCLRTLVDQGKVKLGVQVDLGQSEPAVLAASVEEVLVRAS